MLLPILGAAALLSATPRDTAMFRHAITPTISHTPVTGVKSTMMADSIVVEKSKHTLTLYYGGIPVRSYLVALGTSPKGDKVKIGDGRTPEGLFHMALHISYPDAAHVERANELHVQAGGDIMIHGLPKAYAYYGADHRQTDWTEGCIAVTNQEIEEIFRAVPVGAPIQIKP